MVFHDPMTSLNPVRSVGAQMLDIQYRAGKSNARKRAIAGNALKMVGMPDAERQLARYPHEFSGGMRQRIAIAMSLLQKPELLIADEPTTALDVSVQGEVLNLMNELQQRLGLTYLIITHNLALVRHISDETAIMYMGRFVEQGLTEEIFARAAHPYAAGLIRAQPIPDPSRRRTEAPLVGEVPSLARRPAGCEFHTRCQYVQIRCRSEVPAEQTLAGGRRIRCHFPLA